MSLIKGLVKGDYRRVSELMGEMHGLPQKMGQHLTLYAGEQNRSAYFKSLCTKGRNEDVGILKVLSELDLTSDNVTLSAQASIGQVFRVETPDGVVGVKVQYPKVDKRIKNDFRLLKTLLWPLRFLPLRNSSLVPLVDKLSLALLSECDYKREAENQNRISLLFTDDDDVYVPPVMAYNDRAIVTPWVEGNNLDSCLLNRDEWFIRSYLKFILISLKQLSMVHADPHPGNFVITGGPGEDKRLAVLDFGSVVTFTPEQAQAVANLLSGNYDSEQDLLDDLLVLGITAEVLGVYRPIVGDLVSVLFEPLYYPGDYDFSSWRLQYKMNTLLASRSWDVPLDIPLNLLLLLRTMQGLYFYARSNSIIFNWHENIIKYLG